MNASPVTSCVASADLCVDVQDVSEDPDAPDPASCHAWARSVLSRLEIDRGELSVRIVGEQEGLRLNQQFRQQDRPTNVLSFPFVDPPGMETPLLGDVVICAAVVKREAAEQTKPLVAHWAHMVVHGVLHLCGFDHQTDHEAEKMETLEVEILGTLGFKNPYTEQI